MAKSVQIIGGPHQLNIKSLKELAAELAEIMNINISYGFINDFDYELAKQNNYPDFEFKELGKIHSEKYKDFSRLIEWNYSFKEFLDIYGEKELEHSYFSTEKGEPYQEMILDSLNEMTFELEGEGDSNVYSCNIYKNALMVFFDYYEWYYLQDIFTPPERQYPDMTNWFAEWISKCRNFLRKFGINEYFIICFETSSVLVQDLAIEMHSWEEIKEKTRTEFGNNFLDISRFLITDPITGELTVDKTKIKEMNEKNFQLRGNSPFEIFFDKFNHFQH